MAEIIRNSKFDVLFLDWSRHLNDSIRALAEGAPYESFIERVRELSLVPESLSSWEYEAEPILLAVRGVINKKPGLEVWCYKQPDFTRLSVELAEKIAGLVLRASAAGKIDVDEWRTLIKVFLEATYSVFNEETRYVAEKSKGKKISFCVSGMKARTLREGLRRYGFDADLTYVLLPYCFTPFEILNREMERELEGSFTNSDRILQIIKCHITFVREYVLTSQDYDEAYFKWVNDVAPWVNNRLPLSIQIN